MLDQTATLVGPVIGAIVGGILTWLITYGLTRSDFGQKNRLLEDKLNDSEKEVSALNTKLAEANEERQQLLYFEKKYCNV